MIIRYLIGTFPLPLASLVSKTSWTARFNCYGDSTIWIWLPQSKANDDEDCHQLPAG